MNILISLLEKMQVYYDKISKENLQIYQKILLIENIKNILTTVSSLRDFLNCDYNYYIMKNINENSILDFVNKFFMDFTNKLEEKNPIFWKLVEIDGDIAYYKNSEYFCFDMKNLKEIKNHLNEIHPDIITTYSFNSTNAVFINKNIGLPCINIKSIKNLKKFQLNEKVNKEEIIKAKNVSTKIVVYLFHEIYGHKKFSYERTIKSPYKFIQKNSKEDGENIIKVLPSKQKVDTGTFFELIYGKIGDYYTFEILDRCNNYGKLIDRIDLWLSDFSTFSDYIKYKYFFETKKIRIKNTDNLKIEEEIDQMKEKIQKDKLDIDSLYEKEMKICATKRRKIDENKYISINQEKKYLKILIYLKIPRNLIDKQIFLEIQLIVILKIMILILVILVILVIMNLILNNV